MLFGICPHDTSRNMAAWLDLSVYLRKRLNQEVKATEHYDFKSFYGEDFHHLDMAYVNPMDAWTLHKEKGFIPICRTELPDEVVFITQLEEAKPTLTSIDKQKIACVDRQFATYLGFYILQKQGIEPEGPVFYASWLKVVGTLMNGECQFGVLYKDFYDQLSNLAKKQITVFHTSTEGIATHLFMLSPDYQEYVDVLRQELMQMADSADGLSILNELNIGRWHSITDLESIQSIIEGVNLS